MSTEARTVEVVDDEPNKAIARRESSGIQHYQEERSVDDVLAQMQKVKHLMASALSNGEHYGVIPGTNKPTLLQPGAQKLCFMFRLVPSFLIERTDLPGDHREYRVRCQLHHAGTGHLVGEGVGLCSTMESKYRWRKSERVCPDCGQETIKRSKYEDKETGDKGWYCYGKIGGCGAKFASTDPSIVDQESGKKENPDIADTYNTVLKMSKKRAFVDATLTATAASDSFTQDVEDMDIGRGAPSPEGEPEPLKSQSEVEGELPTAMDFGKHKGTPIVELETRTIEWYLENYRALSPAYRTAFNMELDRRADK